MPLPYGITLPGLCRFLVVRGYWYLIEALPVEVLEAASRGLALLVVPGR